MVYNKSGYKGVALIVLSAALTFFLSPSPAHGQSKELIQAAKREGMVQGYGTLQNETVIKIMKVFKRRYGIEGRYFKGSTTSVMDRALTEYRAGKVSYDVVITSVNPMNLMKEQGLFTAYVSPSSKEFDKEVVDSFFGPRYRNTAIGIVYNTQEIKLEEVPKSYEDLLDPKWKGKITTGDPSRHTTMTNWFESLHLILGSREKADRWIKRFAKQKPILVRNVLPAYMRVSSGETPLAITYIKYMVTLSKGRAPVDYVRGLPGYMGDGHYIGLSSKSPHPNAAKLFIDFFLGQESMKTIANDGDFVNKRGVYPPLPGAEEVVKGFFQMIPMTREQYKKKKKEYKRVFKK